MSSSNPIPGFTGETVGRDEPRYDELRRVFNGMIDRRPALIARCTAPTTSRPRSASRASTGLPLSVYGGGHGVTGSAVCDGGICLDLRDLTAISVDPEARTARVEGGATWGEVDAATQEHGLAVTGGRVSDTGVGRPGPRLAAAAGSSASFGFTCDNLIAAEVVTADGRQVVPHRRRPTRSCSGGCGAAAATSAWSPRSTSGSTRSARSCSAGCCMYPAAMAPDLLRFWRDFMLDRTRRGGRRPSRSSPRRRRTSSPSRCVGSR